ncbi:MAG: hypothetical protein OHK0011_09860 [Turneriella sp.]
MHKAEAALVRALLTLLLLALLASPAHAALVVTEEGQVRGQIIRLEENEVTVRLESGTVQTISKDKILTVHDDEGRLIWSHPSIVLNDTSPEKASEPAKLNLTPQRRADWEIEAALGLGLMSSTAWFSTYPLGVKHDYRLLTEFNLTGLYDLDGSSFVTASLGYSQRDMTANGVTIDGLYGVAVWPIQFIDARLGYRIREEWLFVEAGLLQAFQVGASPVTIDGGSRSTTFADARAATGGYLGFYLALGAAVPVYRDLEGLIMLRYDHGLSSAVDAKIATQTAPDGTVVSSAPLHLVPWSVSAHVGLRYPLKF